MIVDGTHYHDDTPQEVIDVLERARNTGQRVRLHYGTVEGGAAHKRGKPVGEDWGDTFYVAGHISRSMGPQKTPLVVARRNSSGGPAVLDHCIVRIRPANQRDGGDLYRHPDYHLSADTLAHMSARDRDRHFPGWSMYQRQPA
jgi:hypothetical protein